MFSVKISLFKPKNDKSSIIFDKWKYTRNLPISVYVKSVLQVLGLILTNWVLLRQSFVFIPSRNCSTLKAFHVNKNMGSLVYLYMVSMVFSLKLCLHLVTVRIVTSYLWLQLIWSHTEITTFGVHVLGHSFVMHFLNYTAYILTAIPVHFVQ